MKEDWLKDIHDKMADYEADEPCGLWDDICRARQQEEQAGHAGGKASVVWLWARRAAAVAAMVAIVFSAGYFLSDDIVLQSASLAPEEIGMTAAGKASSVVSSSVGHDKNPSTAEAEQVSSSAEYDKKLLAETIPDVHTATPDVRSAMDKNVGAVSAAGMDKRETEQDTSEETSDTHGQTPNQRNDENNRNDSRDPKHSPYNDNYRNNHIAQANVGRGRSGRLSMGVFMAGGTRSAFDSQSVEAVSMGIGSDKSDWKDSPLLGILLYNDGKEVKNDIKHHLPVRAGLSFAYKVNERFALESGVSYTRLTSDMRNGSDRHYITGKQTLHYVGVPLNVKCQIVSWKGFELYASSGVLAEKCVSGKQEKEYVINNRVEKKESRDIGEKPFQWSVNASAGLQYNVLPSAGIYVEPGVSYYFDDGSSLNTIYKDKQFNFNLNLGLRFTFGRK